MGGLMVSLNAELSGHEEQLRLSAPVVYKELKCYQERETGRDGKQPSLSPDFSGMLVAFGKFLEKGLCISSPSYCIRLLIAQAKPHSVCSSNGGSFSFLYCSFFY